MKRHRRFTLAALIAAVCGGSVPVHAAYTVFDPTNAAFNAEQVAKHIEELANQITQIQNQVRQLENEARMLEDLGFSNYNESITSMRRIQALLRDACIDVDAPTPNRIGYESGFDCHDVIERFRRSYPAPTDWAGQPPEVIQRYPDEWNAQKRDAATHAMQTQSASVEAMEGTAKRMAELAAASESAPGQTAAIQATNEMLVTISGQLRDAQATAIAQQRAQALEDAQIAAEHERNKELVRRLTRDAHTTYPLTPAGDPFGLAFGR